MKFIVRRAVGEEVSRMRFRRRMRRGRRPMVRRRGRAGRRRRSVRGMRIGYRM